MDGGLFVFDFVLEDADMAKIDAMGECRGSGQHPDEIDFQGVEPSWRLLAIAKSYGQLQKSGINMLAYKDAIIPLL